MASGQTVTLRFKAVGDFNDIISNAKTLQGYLNKLKLPSSLSGKLAQDITNLQNKATELQSKFEKGFQTKADFSNAVKSAKEMDHIIDEITTELKSIGRGELANAINMDTAQFRNAIQLVDQLKQSIQQIKTSQGLKLDLSSSGLDQFISRSKKAQEMFKNFQIHVDDGNLEAAAEDLHKLETYAKGLSAAKADATGFNNAIGNLKTGLTTLETELAKLPAETRNAITNFTQLKGISLDNLEKEFQEVMAAELQAGNAAKQFGKDQLDAAKGTMDLNSQLSNLKTSANYFFGLQNMFQLLKRGVKDAVDTIKELDASMTETAVVTKFSVEDMWGMLPEYTKAANELGSTINDVYQAATLYYQQGLNQEQAMGLATETLKMARIGGLEAAEATDMMTAALRGFNMEIDEFSAKRINDVYSNLAAKTASNTRELGEAMERTASIAHSANMSFEMTSAFLANMIETTREAPENLGTAMKTIVARFQEMKKNPLTISEVEGEEVDFNRVDTALKSIGVQLTKSKDEFRDLDDVFMDISAKWDSLTQTQQRYIATIAAGSRQQSRFIAMVGNYKRMQELATYANESAGASQIQFNKTLDSMAAKLNRFDNAWNKFLMGITNNVFVKKMVDWGTSFIEIINKIISGISKITGPLQGVTKSVLSLTAAFAGLKLAGKFINSGLGLLGKAIDPSVKGGFFAGATGRKAEANAAQAKAISNPIVAVLRQILAAMPNATNRSANVAAQTGALSKELFKQQYKSIRDTLWNGDKSRNRIEIDPTTGRQKTVQAYKFSDIASKMQGMDSKQQAYIMKNNPALKGAMSKGIFNMLSGGKTELTTQDKLQFKGWTTNLQKYAQTPGTALEMTDLMNPTTPASQQKIVEGLSKVAPEVSEAYAKNLQAAEEKFSKNAKFQNLSPESQEKLLQRIAAKRTGTELGLDFKAMGVEQQITKTDKLAQGFGKVGGAAQGAGIAMQSFGQALSAAGLETAGSVVSGLGTAFMGLGGVISGIGSVLEYISLGPLIAIAAAIAAITIAVTLWKKHQQKIKDDAKEVAENYKKTTETTTKNLSTLEEYRDEYHRLSQGVDENGKNVSLGTEEYQDYLKMTNEIAEMSPTLVKGYNSEGNAILDKNKAIEESIRLQKEEQKQATKDYTSKKAIKKTQKALEQDENYQLGKAQYTPTVGVAGGVMVESEIQSKGRKAINLITAAGGDDILKRYGIDPEHINAAALRILDKQGNAIYKEVESTMTDLEEKQLEGIQEGISDYGDVQKKFKESYAEELNQFKTLAADKGYYEKLEEMGSGYSEMLNQGIESIVANTSYDADQKIEEVEKFYAHLRDLDFANITDELSSGTREDLLDFQENYTDTLESVEQAQEDYLANFNADDYTEATDQQIEDIERWRDAALEAYEETGDIQYQLLYENLANQHALWESFTESNVATIEEGFNTLTNEIAEVNKAYETFQKQMEGGDYYTGAENLEKIYQDIRDGIDDTGKGSRSFWEGGEHLVSENLISERDVDKVADRMDQIHSYLYDDLEKEPAGSGIARWYDDLAKRIKNGALKDLGEEYEDFIKIGKNGQPIFDMADATAEQFENVANALGLSTEAFTALLNKARQYDDIEFANPNLLREAVKEDENVKQIGSGEDAKFVATREYLEGAAESVGTSLEEVSNSLDEAGIKILENADHYLEDKNGKALTGKKQVQGINQWLKTLGIKTGKMSTEDLIGGSIGYASKEDIRAMYDAMVENNLITDAEGEKAVDFNDVYSAALAAKEDPIQSEIKTGVTKIASDVSDIAKYMAIDQGVLAEEQKGYGKEAWDKLVGEKGVADTWEQQFAHGRDAKGNILTEKQHQAALKKIQGEKDAANHEIGILEQQLANAKANGNDEEAEAIKAELDYWKSVLEELERVEKAGTENRDKWEKKVKKEEKDNGTDFTTKQKDIIVGTQLQTNKDLTDFFNTIEADKENVLKVAVEAETEDLDDLIARYGPDGENILNENQIRKIKFVVDNKGADTNLKELAVTENKIVDKKIKVDADTKDATTKIEKVDNTEIADKQFKVYDNMTSVLSQLGLIDKKQIDDKSFSINLSKGFGGKLFNLAFKAFGFTAKGHNNYIPHQSIPTIGSLAKGNAKKFNHGTVGPNDKGGPTLTGEEGFEIAWIPSENRSMILGAKGPQMVNLPKDAVVWTNEQSKKIIRQKAIPAGSHVGPSGGGNLQTGRAGSKYKNQYAKNDVSGAATVKRSSSTKNSNKNKGKDYTKLLVNTLKKGQTISVKIYNTEKRIEQIENKIEKWQSKLDKKLGTTTATLQGVSKTAGITVRWLKESVQENNNLAKIYSKKLTNLDTNKKKSKTSVSWEQPTITYTFKKKAKSVDKNGKVTKKKTLKKADRKRMADILANSDEHIIKYKKNSKGKKVPVYDSAYKTAKAAVLESKKGKKTVKKSISLNKYIYKDPITGAYQIDQKAINKLGRQNKDKAKAVKEAAQKKIDEYTSGRDQARQAREQAKQELDELSQKMYETFFGWKNELTKLANITQKLNAQLQITERFAGMDDLRQAIIESGKSVDGAMGGLVNSNKLFQNQMTAMGKAIDMGQKQIEASKENVTRVMKGTDYKREKQDAWNQRKKTAKKQEQAKKKLDKKEAAYRKAQEKYRAGKISKKKLNEAKSAYKDANSKYEKLVGEYTAQNERYKRAKEAYKAYQKASKYVDTYQNGDGTLRIDFNTSQLEKDRDAGKITAEQYNVIKEYADALQQASEELNQAYNEQAQRIAELYTTLKELQEQYAQYASDLRGQLEELKQSEIEKLDKLYNVLNDQIKKLLDQVKKNLDKRRQEEDNKKTEEDIAQKQQRLAALKADRSGSNAKQIKQLEKEIADAQQSYTRTLEDQSLQRMQDEADEAAEQREEQIKILNAQLEWAKATGELARKVEYWLAHPVTSENEMYEMWKKNNHYNELTEQERTKLDNEFRTMMADLNQQSGLPAKIAAVNKEIDNAQTELTKLAQAANLLTSSLGAYDISNGSSGRAVQSKYGLTAKQTQKAVNSAGASQSKMAGVKVKKGADGTYTDKKGKTHTVNTSNGTINAKGTRIAASQKDKVYLEKWDKKEGEGTGEITSHYDINNINATQSTPASVIKSNQSEFREAFKYAITNQKVGSIINPQAAALVKALGIVGKTYKINDGHTGSISSKGKIYYNAGDKVKIWDLSTGKMTSSKSMDQLTKKERTERVNYKNVGREYKQAIEYWNKKHPKKAPLKYASGGLATETGPAWLDGTKSKPELVLNAQDTKNFIALKDVLSRAVSGSGDIMNDTNMTYDIDINVDHIASDYDVDQIANRVKKQITQSASYRNVNAVRNIR